MDLDGTLLGPGAMLSDRTIRAVKKCLQRGIQIIIATGRAIEAAERFRQSLGAEGPMIYFNGAVVADMPGAKILNSAMLDSKAAEFCIDLAREMGVFFQIYFHADERPGGTLLLSEFDCPEREMYYKHTGILTELGDLKEALQRYGTKGCIKTMFLVEPDVQAVLRPRLIEALGESVYVVQTLWNFLEVMDVKASKGKGLKFVMDRLSFKSEEVIAFGDEENDLPMFEAAGFFVAPLNGKETVKAKADLIAGSNAEDGVAVFLEEFFGL